jgi:isopentenyl-diphosphate delta-isomerase type 1
VTEYLDIVDENDLVIGRDTRANVHTEHKIHRGVHVFVVNAKGELLIQRRASTRSYYPGFWDASVGGQVLAGESYEQAASRELLEELSCEGPLRLVAKYNAYSERQREKRALFVHLNDGPFQPSATEIDEIALVPPENLADLMQSEPFTEGFRRSFDLWLAERVPS